MATHSRLSHWSAMVGASPWITANLTRAPSCSTTTYQADNRSSSKTSASNTYSRHYTQVGLYAANPPTSPRMTKWRKNSAKCSALTRGCSTPTTPTSTVWTFTSAQARTNSPPRWKPHSKKSPRNTKNTASKTTHSSSSKPMQAPMAWVS